MNRTVILTVDNDRATHIKIQHVERVLTPEAGGRSEDHTIRIGRVPVPPDDQLTEALKRTLVMAEAMTHLVEEKEGYLDALVEDRRAYALVRAAAGLDEGSEDEP